MVPTRQQLRVLIGRCNRIYWRSPSYNLVRTLLVLLLAALFGTVFWRMEVRHPLRTPSFCSQHHTQRCLQRNTRVPVVRHGISPYFQKCALLQGIWILRILRIRTSCKAQNLPFPEPYRSFHIYDNFGKMAENGGNVEFFSGYLKGWGNYCEKCEKNLFLHGQMAGGGGGLCPDRKATLVPLMRILFC